ncbi:MAG: RHS repeat-associated core domain-containing protein [Candidatus Acidiferrales bacterium]
MVRLSWQYSFLTGTFTNAYTYDAASNRTGFTAPDSSTDTYSYDTLNRLTTLANSWAGSFGFSYDSLSRRTQMTRPNSLTTNYTYDNKSRLLSVLHQLSGSTIDGATYTVDAAGNRTAKTDQLASVTSNYTYDSIYELTQVTQGGTATESYSYDAVGNRTASLGVSSYTNNSSNELTATSNASYSYDNNGNTTSKTESSGTANYTWDFENRLTSVTLPNGGGSVTFKYDPFGRRIQKVFTQNSTTTTTNYVYDGADTIEETDQNGSLLGKYARTPNIDEPLAESRSGATSFYEQDGLGSVTSLSNSAGALANTYTLDSFGKLTASTGSLTNPLRYTGRDFDTETGFHYYRFRYYDPSLGRFVSEDLVRFKAGVNFYSYGLNDPADNIDPSGLDTIVCLFPEAANGLGHIGFGFPGDPYTVGFYPLGPANGSRCSACGQVRRLHGPGAVWPDVGEGPRQCKRVYTTPTQDKCMLQCRIKRAQNPGTYDVGGLNCVDFTRDCLKECGIPAGTNFAQPKDWWPTLPGDPIGGLPPTAPLPR